MEEFADPVDPRNREIVIRSPDSARSRSRSPQANFRSRSSPAASQRACSPARSNPRSLNSSAFAGSSQYSPTNSGDRNFNDSSFDRRIFGTPVHSPANSGGIMNNSMPAFNGSNNSGGIFNQGPPSFNSSNNSGGIFNQGPPSFNGSSLSGGILNQSAPSSLRSSPRSPRRFGRQNASPCLAGCNYGGIMNERPWNGSLASSNWSELSPPPGLEQESPVSLASSDGIPGRPYVTPARGLGAVRPFVPPWSSSNSSAYSESPAPNSIPNSPDRPSKPVARRLFDEEPQNAPASPLTGMGAEVAQRIANGDSRLQNSYSSGGQFPNSFGSSIGPPGYCPNTPNTSPGQVLEQYRLLQALKFQNRMNNEAAAAAQRQMSPQAASSPIVAGPPGSAMASQMQQSPVACNLPALPNVSGESGLFNQSMMSGSSSGASGAYHIRAPQGLDNMSPFSGSLASTGSGLSNLPATPPGLANMSPFSGSWASTGSPGALWTPPGPGLMQQSPVWNTSSSSDGSVQPCARDLVIRQRMQQLNDIRARYATPPPQFSPFNSPGQQMGPPSGLQSPIQPGLPQIVVPQNSPRPGCSQQIAMQQNLLA